MRGVEAMRAAPQVRKRELRRWRPRRAGLDVHVVQKRLHHRRAEPRVLRRHLCEGCCRARARARVASYSTSTSTTTTTTATVSNTTRSVCAFQVGDHTNQLLPKADGLTGTVPATNLVQVYLLR
jgi:hypothetical protein